MDKLPRQLDILLFDGVNVLDVAGPAQAFSAANSDGTERYRLRFVTTDGKSVQSNSGLRLQADGDITGSLADDLLLPGGEGVDDAINDDRIITLVREWQAPKPDKRLISICTGALLLAKAGILNGRQATTHWYRDAQVREAFPDVNWCIDNLFTIDGTIMTSAGVSSGIDLSLEIIQRDFGSSVSLMVARELVVYLKRSGNQSQFSDLLSAQFSADRELNGLIKALQDSPRKEWTLEMMAEAANMTPRTLSRRFQSSTGYSPVKFLERYRVKRATDALSAGASSGVAVDVSGFPNFQKMQRAFKRQLGTTVGSYREKFFSDGDR